MDCYATATLIRSEFQELPIIALTAYAMEEKRVRVLGAGMSDFVTKPIRIKALYGALTAC